MAICFVPGTASRRLTGRRLPRAGTCQPGPDVNTSARALSVEATKGQSATSGGPADRMPKYASRCPRRAVATS